jgi:hypothetical protein
MTGRTVWLLLLALTLVTAAGCGSSSGGVIATFSREWDDGRIETLELYDDGRVLMDHVGYLDRVTLSAADVATLRSALTDIRPASDPAAYPRLTLTATGAEPVVVGTDPGTVGELFETLLDMHRLP